MLEPFRTTIEHFLGKDTEHTQRRKTILRRAICDAEKSSNHPSVGLEQLEAHIALAIRELDELQMVITQA